MAGKLASPPLAKITRPTLPEVFPRPRLFRALDRARKRRVVWITGPPGSGKTTLVASYLSARKIKSLWYQIDPGDADPATFFYYMGLAAKRAAPRYKTPLPLLTPEYRPGLEIFTRRFIHLLCDRMPKRCVLVLDNYQAVPPDSSFHEVIRNSLDSMPGGGRVIVISRSDLPPSLAHLRAARELTVIEGDELRATPKETRGIARLKHSLPEETVRTLHETTGGWTAGIILMAQRAGRGYPMHCDRHGSLTKEVFDYFAGEVFERADPEIREFLLQTAFLPKMTIRVAEGLTGLQRSGRILSELNRRNFFTEKREENPPVYKYHSLFRKFLLDRAGTTWTPAVLSQVRHLAATRLEEAGQFEDAVGLFQDAGDWSGMARLAIRQAPGLVSQGRQETLEKWLSAIPSSVIEENSWLLYWMGICRLPFNPPSSRNFLERAFNRFTEMEDDTGSLLAWSGSVNSILFEWGDFARLDRWAAWLDERMRRIPEFPSPEIEARVVCDMAHILVFRQLDHPKIQTWMVRARAFSRESPDSNLRLQVASILAAYYMWTGQLRMAKEIVDELREISRSPGVSPLIVIQAKIREAMYFAVCTTSPNLALRAVTEGLEIGRTHGIRMAEAALYGQAFNAFINIGDLKSAEEYLEKVRNAMIWNLSTDVAFYYFLCAMLALTRGQAASSLHYAEKSTAIMMKIGFIFADAASHLATAQALHENGAHRKAARELAIANRMNLRMKSRIEYFRGLLTEAQFVFEDGKAESDSRGLKALRQAMQIGREEGYVNFSGWRPSVMSKLCAKALEHRIEPDYIRHLIRTRYLIPDASFAGSEEWPWPMKIYTLGRFGLVRDGTSLRLPKRGQGRIIELLKALIALGSREVDQALLIEALWQEAEGDKAHQAFRTTLHRLRKLLGKEEVISAHEGRVTLNPRHCWVDVWAFERRLGKDADMASMEKAIALYQGRFLENDFVAAWAMPLRERLHAKYLHCLSELGRRWETAEEWGKAATLYQRGLEVDPLVEEYYQRLMVCQQRRGHRAEAMSVYRRCREALRIHLEIVPSPETETIARTIKESGNPR